MYASDTGLSVVDELLHIMGSMADYSGTDGTDRAAFKQNRYVGDLTSSAKAVIDEFKQLMLHDGYLLGSGRDGTASKYCRYMEMLFECDDFKCRDDFFKPLARSKAHEFYMDCAKKKEQEGSGKTPASKLYKNWRNGFDKYVFLASFHVLEASATVPAPLPEQTEREDRNSVVEYMEGANEMSVDDILNLIDTPA